jgi:tRNA(Ile)-lysidine synthase
VAGNGLPPARKSRLNPTIGVARNLVRDTLEQYLQGLDLRQRPVRRQNGAGAPPLTEAPLVLVACSGGPDSLALAVVAGFFARRGQLRVGGVVVDHGLQEGSDRVASGTAEALRGMGLSPVEVRRVSVDTAGMGPEAAARTARYAAIDAVAAQHGASAVLLGHTLDDQAEQVLLGLARGSGTRSLAGMRTRRGIYLRPFLDLRRTDTLAICAAEGLQPWYDPTNLDPAFARSRVRAEVMPYLEEQLGPGVAEALHRTSRILAQDADYLDELSAAAFAELASAGGNAASGRHEIQLPEQRLRDLPPSLRQRVMARAAVELGGSQPSFERLQAAQALLNRRGSAGPIQLSGKVSVRRQVRGKSIPHQGRSYGSLVFSKTSGGSTP